MSLFRKAESSKIGMKLLAYGDSGTGKSTFGLTFPDIAVIDSESGLAHYEDSPNIKLIANTSSSYDVEDAMDEIEDNLDEIRTFIIDSETKIYDAMQVSAMEVEEKRAKNKGGNIEDSVVSQRGWGRIKLLNKRLQSLKIQLSSQGVNVVSIAQMDDVKEKRGDSFVKVGEKPNMAKGIQYDYDTVLKLFTEKDVNGNETYKALVEKDRTRVFKKGDIIVNPSYDHWKNYIESKADLKIRTVNFSKDIENDIIKMTDEAEKMDDLIASFKEKMKSFTDEKDKQVKVQKKIKELGIDNPLKTDDFKAMTELLEFMNVL